MRCVVRGRRGHGGLGDAAVAMAYSGFDEGLRFPPAAVGDERAVREVDGAVDVVVDAEVDRMVGRAKAAAARWFVAAMVAHHLDASIGRGADGERVHRVHRAARSRRRARGVGVAPEAMQPHVAADLISRSSAEACAMRREVVEAIVDRGRRRSARRRARGHDHREGEAEDDDGADEATALIAPASALCHQGRVTLVYPAG